MFSTFKTNRNMLQADGIRGSQNDDGDNNSSVDSDQEMLDIEKGNILKALEERSLSNSVRTCTSANETTWGPSKGPFVRSSSRVCTSVNHKWRFSLVILLLGAVAAALVMLFGISGVSRQEYTDFLHEAKQLTNVLELSWSNYVTLALWIHESCHFDYGDGVSQTEEDVAISSRMGFCSREKFDHLYVTLDCAHRVSEVCRLSHVR